MKAAEIMTPEEFRQERKRIGLTQEQLAAILHVAHNTVARWEQGRSPITGPVAIAVRSLPSR